MPAKKSTKLFPADLYELTVEDKKRFADERALGMVAPNDPILVKKAAVVDPKTIGSGRIADVVQRLLATAGGQQQADPSGKKLRLLVGLAGPQIGESLRIIVVDTKILPSRKKAGKLECFINPQIVWRSHETDELREGCFSAGPVWGLVRRPVAVKVRAFTPDGQKVERIFEDFTARIMQHEIDHLDGIRFPDRIQNDRKRHWVHAEEIPLYPEHINHWPRLCSLARWHDFIA